MVIISATCLLSFLSLEKTNYKPKLEIVPGISPLHNETNHRAGGVKLLQAPYDEESLSDHLDAYSNGAAISPGTSISLDVQHAKAEVRHIGFVKVHKAASSTVQNIFFRFGKKRGLTFVFTVHPNYFSRTARFSLPLVKPSKRSSYDIICNHGVFNKSVYGAILPKDTVYLAIVRQPLDLFISSVNYYTQKRYLLDYLARVPGNKLQNLIQKPEIYDKALFSYTRNVLARDLGFPATNDTSVINKKLEELGKTLKLVLLVEYFDESLILMKRYLHWGLEDILHLSNNVYRKDGMSLNDITPADVEKFKERNALDYRVYDFFYHKFWKQFAMETEDIYEEILHFKRVLTKVRVFCNGEPLTQIDFLILAKSNWNDEIRVTANDCKYMKIEELDFIRELRVIQGSELQTRRRVLPPGVRRFPRMAIRRQKH